MRSSFALVAVLIMCALAQGAMYEEASAEVVNHEDVVEQLVQQEVTASDVLPTKYKPCGEREEQTTQLLNAYQAARLLHDESPKFGVKDETTSQLVQSWKRLYMASHAEYVFYCKQTQEDLNTISLTVKKKEMMAVRNAAQAGLLAAQAAIKHRRFAAEKAHKADAKRKKKEATMKEAQRRRAQEKTDKMAQKAIAKNMKRLRNLPSITRHLYGKVRDAMTGKSIANADIQVACLFKTSKSTSAANGAFTMSSAVSGPIGRQCDMHVRKSGYSLSTTPITVRDLHTDSVYRDAMLLPKISSKTQFRFVLQYGSTPPNLDAHVLVPSGKNSYVDIAENRLDRDTRKIKFGHSGAKNAAPFTTLDHSAQRYGPETATIHQVHDGVYHFVVVNAAQSFTTPKQFQDSTARAFLYQGNKLVKTVSINSAGGTATQMWYVFSLACSKGECKVNLHNRFIKKNPA